MKNDSYLDVIEEFNEDVLPNVSISKDEINKIKEKVIGVINNIKEEHKNIDFKITVDEAIKIRESLGNNPDKAIFGVKNANLIRKLLIENMKKEENIKDEEIVAEYFTELSSTAWWWKASVCYQMFLTKERIIIYAFDAWYNVNTRKNLPISEIKEAGYIDDKIKILDAEAFVVVFKDGTSLEFDPRYSNTKEEAEKFIKALMVAGIKKTKKNNKRDSRILMGIYIFVGLYLLWLSVEMLL